MQEEPREDDAVSIPGFAVPKEHTALFNKHVGAEIALWRKVLDMGQEEFAKQFGADRWRLSRIENGKVAMRMDEFNAVANLVGVNFVDLIHPAYLRYHSQIRSEGVPGRPGA